MNILHRYGLDLLLKFYILLFLMFLPGCAQPPKPTTLEIPREPIIIGIHEPSNSVLMSAIEDYINLRMAPSYTQFEYTRIDLDNDGRRDAIVMLKSPSNFWCSDYGCRLVIFKANNKNFGLLGEMSQVRGPLLVSNQTSNGWRDIVIREDGRGARARHVLMKFNGMSYPSNSQYEKTYFNIDEFNGTRILP